MANVDHCGTCSYKPPRDAPKLKDLETPHPPPKKPNSLTI